MFKPRIDEHSSIRQLKRVLLRLYFGQSPEMDRLAVTLSRLDKLPDKMTAYIGQIEAELIQVNEGNVYSYQKKVRSLLNEHIYSLGDEHLFTIAEEKTPLPPPSPRDASLSELYLSIPGIASSSIPSTAPSLSKEPSNKQDIVNHFQEYRELMTLMVWQLKSTHWIHEHLMQLKEENYFIPSDVLASLRHLNDSHDYALFVNGMANSNLLMDLLFQLEVNYDSMLICCFREAKATGTERDDPDAANLRQSTIRLVMGKITELARRQASKGNESGYLAFYRAVLQTAIILVEDILPPDDPFQEEIVTEHLAPLLPPSLWIEFLSTCTAPSEDMATCLRMRSLRDFLCTKLESTSKVKSTTSPWDIPPPVMRQESVHQKKDVPLSPPPPSSSPDTKVSLAGERSSDGFGCGRYRLRPVPSPPSPSPPTNPFIKPSTNESFKAAIDETLKSIPSVNYDKDIDGFLRLYEGVKRLDNLFAFSGNADQSLQKYTLDRLLTKMSIKKVEAFERWRGPKTVSRFREWLKRQTISVQSYAYPGYCAYAQRKGGVPSMAYWYPPVDINNRSTVQTRFARKR